MGIPERIIQLRNASGLSQGQLAKLMDVSRQAVSKWENGLSTPEPGKLLQLAEILNTDLSYLASGKVTPVPEPVEKIVEVPVEVPVVQFVDRVSVQRVVRKQYIRNPFEYALVAFVSLAIGVLIGLFL